VERSRMFTTFNLRCPRQAPWSGSNREQAVRFPEPVFADEAILVWNLRGVLSGLKTRQLGRQRPVEVHEERIRPSTDFRFAGHSNRVAEGFVPSPSIQRMADAGRR